MEADALIIGTPIFQASIPATLKNIFDLLPVNAFRDKVVSMLVTAGSPKHYLIAEQQLKPILAYMKAHIVPTYVFIEEKDYNRVRIGQIEVHPELSKTINQNTFFAGIFYQKYSVDSTSNRYISDLPANGLDPEIFDTQDYAGINLGYEFDSRDSKTLTTRGIYWNTNASFYIVIPSVNRTEYNCISG